MALAILKRITSKGNPYAEILEYDGISKVRSEKIIEYFKTILGEPVSFKLESLKSTYVFMYKELVDGEALLRRLTLVKVTIRNKTQILNSRAELKLNDKVSHRITFTKEFIW